METIESKELFDTSRVARDLGLKFRRPEETLADTVEALMAVKSL